MHMYDIFWFLVVGPMHCVLSTSGDERLNTTIMSFVLIHVVAFDVVVCCSHWEVAATTGLTGGKVRGWSRTIRGRSSVLLAQFLPRSASAI